MNSADCRTAAAFPLPATRPALPKGALLHNSAYEIVGVLGSGGFGITYEAHAFNDNDRVAIKEFFPERASRIGSHIEPEASTNSHFVAARRKFLSEARVLNNLRHPNLVRVRAAFEENNTAYTVMELLRGETLAQLIERSGAQPESDAVSIVKQVAQGLQAVHEEGLLHLDVKPENVFLCDDAPAEKPRAVLMDFDLLQPVTMAAHYRTRPLHVTVHCGTPGYAPLEQYAQGAAFGVYTDIYALGATLFHLLTGQTPPDSVQRAAQHSDLGLQNITTQTREAVTWAIQLQPLRRPQSVRDFLDAFEARHVASTPNAGTRSGRRVTGVLSNSAPPASATLTTPAAHPAGGNAQAPVHLSGQSSPVAAPHDDYWYIVSFSAHDFIWPQLCACCAAAAETTVQLRVAKEQHAIPYCLSCARHVSTHRNALACGVAGMSVGLFIAASGALFSSLVLGPIGAFLHFGAMFYWGLQHSFSSELTRPQCSDTRIAVEFAGSTSGRARWKFRNAQFTQEVRRLNAANVI